MVSYIKILCPTNWVQTLYRLFSLYNASLRVSVYASVQIDELNFLRLACAKRQIKVIFMPILSNSKWLASSEMGVFTLP